MTPDRPDRPADLRDLVGDHDCREVLADVWSYLDGEVEQAEAAHIQRHLEDCEPCLRKYGLDQLVKTMVHRSCGKEDTPVALRERVLTSLRSVTVTSGEAGVEITETAATIITDRPL